MNRPRICAVITSIDADDLKSASDAADLFELRIDLIGTKWREFPGKLSKPWIATNRNRRDCGNWTGSEESRQKELLEAVRMGAIAVDTDLGTPGLDAFVAEIKQQAECIISYHDFNTTPSRDVLEKIVSEEIKAGADICKVVTTASTVADNLTVLNLLRQFPEVKMVALAMGEAGRLSRLICPLAGGAFTFAMIRAGKGSAAGQMALDELRRLYQVMGYD